MGLKAVLLGAGLALAAGVAEAQNATAAPTDKPSNGSTPAPSPAGLQFPAAVVGKWHFVVNSAPYEPVCASMKDKDGNPGGQPQFCFWERTVTETLLKDEILCQCFPNATLADLTSVTKSWATPKAVSCGQETSTGRAHGVFGGWYWTSINGNWSIGEETNVTAIKSSVCEQYQIVSGTFARGDKTEWLMMGAWSQPGNNNGSAFACADQTPTQVQAALYEYQLVPKEAMLLTNGRCQSGWCLTESQALCNPAGQSPQTSIGIGFSVGGVAVLIVTVAAILSVQSSFQKN